MQNNNPNHLFELIQCKFTQISPWNDMRNYSVIFQSISQYKIIVKLTNFKISVVLSKNIIIQHENEIDKITQDIIFLIAIHKQHNFNNSIVKLNV